MGIGQLIMMPLFFASSALYPLAIMPGWLRAVARVNPLTYEVQGLRQMLVGDRRSRSGVAGLPGRGGLLRGHARGATRAYPKSHSLTAGSTRRR